MRTKQWTMSKVYQPAAVGGAETVALFNVKKGWRVIGAWMMPLIAAAVASNTSISVGDGTAVAGFIGVTDTETMVPGTPVDGQGAFFNQGSKLYTVDDTIDADYIVTVAGATNPKVRVFVTVRDERYG